MMRGSESSGIWRTASSPCKRCARVALVLAFLLTGLQQAVRSESLLLQPPVAAADESLAGTPDTQTAAIVAAPAAPVAATAKTSAPRESDDLATALERPGDLNLHGLTLNAALFTISEQWNINIVAGEVQGTVNGVFKQAPLREILDSILLSNGYNYRAVGKSLVVSSIADLGQINPFFQSATIPVQTADIDEVVEGAKLLNTPQGQVRALKSARSIVVLDFPDRVKMIREFVATLDGASGQRFGGPDSRNGLPLEVAHFRTQHIAARAAEQALQAVLSKDGRIGVMEKEDRLVVTDYDENLTLVEKVLARIDQPRPQVRITALIYDISLQDVEKLGINWNPTLKTRVDANGDAQSSLGVDSVLQVPFQAGAAGSTLTFMSLSRHFDITAVAMCLQSASDARLLADPNVAVLENEEAIFKGVSEIPYQQLTQTPGGGGGANAIATTAFKEAGITLRVRPKIAADGTIRMDVTPEFSRLTGFTPGDNQPIIDVRSASTVLSIANRQTVVIGGLRQRSDVGDFNGLPYLKDLKYVGRLFRSRSTDVRESELVVFIMPEIIGYADEPNCRQQMVEETIRCRLDQVPEAEGCSPCCRRLPPGMMEGAVIEPTPAGVNKATKVQVEKTDRDAFAPVQQPDDLPPLSAALIPSAEFQFGVAGRAEHVRALVADGRLRRLPTIESAPAIGQDALIRTANGQPIPSLLR